MGVACGVVDSPDPPPPQAASKADAKSDNARPAPCLLREREDVDFMATTLQISEGHAQTTSADLLVKQILRHVGNPATLALARCRPEALRPRLSTGLPSMQYKNMWQTSAIKYCGPPASEYSS
jgi:hypothetical protein